MINRNDPCWCGSGKKYKKCHFPEEGPQQLSKEKKDLSGNIHSNIINKAKLSEISKKYIKSPKDIAGMRKAGIFNGEVLDYIRPYIKAGISTEEINNLVHEYTVSHGHTPACLGYRGYPKSVCTSINDVVCHGIPSPNEILKEGDIINVDVTSIVDGYYGDSSETFTIGKVSEEAMHLVLTTAEALIRGIDAARPGVPLIAIAEAIEPFVESRGCSVVRQYTGHGIGKNFHEDFTVYHHIDEYSKDIILMPGMTLTIEPMVNLGGFEVVTDKVDKWTVRTKDGSLSAQFEHTILITEDKAEVLTLTPSQRKAGVRLIVGDKYFV